MEIRQKRTGKLFTDIQLEMALKLIINDDNNNNNNNNSNNNNMNNMNNDSNTTTTTNNNNNNNSIDKNTNNSNKSVVYVSLSEKRSHSGVCNTNRSAEAVQLFVFNQHRAGDSFSEEKLSPLNT